VSRYQKKHSLTHTSFHASIDFSIFQFPNFFFFCLTASATSSFHHHVSLCLHWPFHNPCLTCAVSIIIFFICCQCLLTSMYFHSASAILSLTMLWYSSHAFSSLSFHTCTLGSNFLHHLFVVLNCMSHCPLLTIYALVHILYFE